MVDANVVGTNETAVAQTRHWLVNDVTLKNGALDKNKNNFSEILTR